MQKQCLKSTSGVILFQAEMTEQRNSEINLWNLGVKSDYVSNMQLLKFLNMRISLIFEFKSPLRVIFILKCSVWISADCCIAL